MSMNLADLAVTVITLCGLFCLASLIAVVAERYVLWQRQRAIRRIMRELEKEQREWRETWSPSGDY